MFNEVADEMKKYFDILEQWWINKKREGQWFLGLGNLKAQLVLQR